MNYLFAAGILVGGMVSGAILNVVVDKVAGNTPSVAFTIVWLLFITSLFMVAL